MAKIRTVKPELFRHEELFEAEKQSGFPLRLIFIGLFTTADAAGRFRWKPKQLKLDILPYDEIDFEKALEALAQYHFIIKYEHQGQWYGVIPSWHKHQSINKREPESRLPSYDMCMQMQNVVVPLHEGEVQSTASVLHHSEHNAQHTTTSVSILSNSLEESITTTCHPTNACTCMHMQTPASHLPTQKMHLSLSGMHKDNHERIEHHTATTKQNAAKEITPALPFDGEILQEKPPESALFIEDLEEKPITISPPCKHPPDSCTCTHMQNRETHMHASLEMEVEMERELEMDMELEGKGCGKGKPKRELEMMQVFEHWKFVMRHPRAVLDKQRKKLIRDALAMGYDVKALCKAIDGCSQTPHNMGHNERGERYDGLHIILRSAEQIDRFIHNALHPLRPMNKAEKRLHENLNAAKTWLAEGDMP